MGRPIKKSFFANLNAPYQDHATGGPTGEGGEGVASVTIVTTGTYVGVLPTVSFGTPDLFSGVAAAGTVHGKALTASTTVNGTGTNGASYNVGEVLSVDGGVSTTTATFTVAAVTTVGVPTKNNGGTNYQDGDTLTFSGAGWTQNLVLRVERPGGGSGTPDYFTVVQAGRRNAATPANPVTPTSHTGTGTNCTVDIIWGVFSINPATEGGDYTTVPVNPVSFTEANGGTGATADITWGVKSVRVTTTGSHYISPADAAITFDPAGAAATSVLTNLFDNGLAVYVHLQGGGTGVLADIMKQESSRRYLVKERDGREGQCRLVAVAPGALAVGEMCLIATDTALNTYYVTKLTAHRAVLTQKTKVGTDWLFDNDGSAGWTLGSASLGVVSVANV